MNGIQILILFLLAEGVFLLWLQPLNCLAALFVSFLAGMLAMLIGDLFYYMDKIEITDLIKKLKWWTNK
jgi:uncharacterized membrane protein YciS (DUF1049 family)